MTYGRLQRNARYAYQNFCALLMICVGYLLTPFGINEDPWRETAIIIPFVVAVNIMVRKAAKRINYNSYLRIIIEENGVVVCCIEGPGAFHMSYHADGPWEDKLLDWFRADGGVLR